MLKIVTLIIILIISISSASPVFALPIDLTEHDIYVRENFKEEWINTLPDPSDNNWIKVPAKKGNRPVRVRELGLPGLPKFSYLSIKKEKPRTFTFVTSFTMTQAEIDSGALALQQAQIGWNWEIYLNGTLVKSDVHLSPNGNITIERAIRNAIIPIRHVFFIPGKNILTFKIIGDPTEDRTGFFMRGPYLIDDYSKLIRQNQEYLEMMLIIIYIFFGLYHILLFILRRREIINFFFGLLAIYSGMYLFSRTHIIFSIIQDSSYIRSIDLFSLGILMPLFITVADLMINEKIRTFTRHVMIYAIILGTIQLFFFQELILRIQQIAFIILCFYTIVINTLIPFYRTVKTFYNEQKYIRAPLRLPLSILKSIYNSTAGNLLIGNILVFATTLVDIKNVNIGYTQFYLQYSCFAFIMGLVAILANRFVRVHRRMEELNISLEEKVNDRTKNLIEVNKQLTDATSELSQANEKLKEVDRLKTNFFANVSHEIRTPLTLILSPVESAIQGEFGEHVDKNFLENIRRNAVRLLSLVNNLLDLSKIEAGRMGMTIIKKNIVSYIRGFIDIIHSAAESHGISVAFSPSVSTIDIYIDSEKVDKIIMNLLSNALKFTEKGGSITARITETQETCAISIEDNGIGIPADKIGIVFDRFSQADSSSIRKYEGTGIGLALVKELVEMHGGSITVASRHIDDNPDDHGTVFTCIIPKGKGHFTGRNEVEFITEDEAHNTIIDRNHFAIAHRAPLTPDGDEDHAETDGTILPKVVKGMHTVLIVEDNPDMRDFLRSLLEREYRVETAENGEKGLELAIELKPDAIVSDVMMPVMNGYEMTQKIKNTPEIKHIPVLLLTARAEIADKIEGLEQGADDYLTKPFNSKELYARVKALIKTMESEKVIIARNREIEDEMETARLLQQKLLPESIDEISGYALQVLYLPMDKIGGDFYDFKANDEQIELLIADVSGHGLPGSFLSTIAKMSFEGIKRRTSTMSVLYVMNDVICRSSVKGMFITLFYCIIDRNTNSMTYTNAGHNPPLVYRQATGEFFKLETKGTALGWFKTLKLEEKTFMLQQGDRIILYTDGVTECTDAGSKEFGEERLMEFIRANHTLPPRDLCPALLSELKQFSGQETFHDDLCLMALDVL